MRKRLLNDRLTEYLAFSAGPVKLVLQDCLAYRKALYRLLFMIKAEVPTSEMDAHIRRALRLRKPKPLRKE